jgi:tetratricopeptide (TPR) repeat protein
VGIPINLQGSSKLLACCQINPFILEFLAEHGFLLKQVQFNKEQFRIRHEKYAVEFLVYLYSKLFGNNPEYFDQTYEIKDIIKCIWNNIAVDDIIDLLTGCSYLYKIPEDRYISLSEIIAADYVIPYDKFVIPSQISDSEKTRLFCYGLGNFYTNRKDYTHSLEYYGQCIKIDNNFVAAWYYKGLALGNLGRDKESLECYDKALEIKPDYAEAWYNKGLALGNLGRDEEALECYDKALEIDPDYVDAWNNCARSNARIGDIEKALSDLEKAIEIGGDIYTKYAKEDHSFDDIRSHERFKKLIKNTGAV